MRAKRLPVLRDSAASDDREKFMRQKFMRRLASLPCVLLFVLWLAGCAIAEQRRDIDTTAQRIETKRGTLEGEERQQAALVAQRDQLMADLGSRELNAAQLRARLESMRIANDAVPVATPADRRKRDDRARRLAELANRAKAVEQDPGPSGQEKARRTAALRDSTRKGLEALLEN